MSDQTLSEQFKDTYPILNFPRFNRDQYKICSSDDAMVAMFIDELLSRRILTNDRVFFRRPYESDYNASIIDDLTLNKLSKFINCKYIELYREGNKFYSLFEFLGLKTKEETEITMPESNKSTERRINLDPKPPAQHSDNFYVLSYNGSFLLNDGKFGEITGDLVKGTSLKALFDRIHTLESECVNDFTWKDEFKPMKVTAIYNLTEVEK